MNPSKTPSVRFKGYEDEWEERKSKDLFTPINERNREDLPVLSVTQDQGVVLRNDLAIDIKYDKSTLSSYKVIHPGDFVISLRSFQGGFELSKVLGISSPAYTIFDLKNLTAHNKLYWKYIFKSFKFIESLKTVTFGIRDGKSISFREFSDLKINYPSDASEQEKIGSFFQQLDETIDLHQRKLDLLKEQKKGYLQKMFPKNGAKVPELRFAGFTDAWEERKFKKFSKKTGKKNSKNLDFPAYSVSNKSGLISQTEQFDGGRLDSLEKTSYKFVEPNEFAYNPARINVGSIAFNNLGKTVIVSSLYVVVKMSEDLDNEFILQFIKSPAFIKEVKRNTEGSVREYLFYENFANIKFPFTKNKEEQQQIGTFFQQLDATITLHQRKIDELKLMKKSMLQKMFV
ncbi:restriction endonuclease subunit S [Enterococcus italicus]|uniref:restriction endonuclease subunit S n=1 Tax=Enterococcus italicus TaxID=246144 RepID=UPI003F48094D